MDEPMDVDDGSLTNHQLVTVGSDGHHIVIGGSEVHPANVTIKPEIVRHQPEHQSVRKIQPQIKLASKDSGNTIRIAPSNIQGED